MFTCQQNLNKRHTHVKHTHTCQPCLHGTHPCGCYILEDAKHVLQRKGSSSSSEMCLFPHKRKRQRRRKNTEPGNPADLHLLNHPAQTHLLLFPSLSPSPWSLNQNGKRLFHLSIRGVPAAFFPRFSSSLQHCLYPHPEHVVRGGGLYRLRYHCPGKAISPLISH